MRNRKPVPHQGAFTALMILTMIAAPEQLDQAEQTLRWCALNKPSVDDFTAGLEQLRLAKQAAEEA
jgi:hypothetical protein